MRTKLWLLTLCFIQTKLLHRYFTYKPDVQNKFAATWCLARGWDLLSALVVCSPVYGWSRTVYTVNQELLTVISLHWTGFPGLTRETNFSERAKVQTSYHLSRRIYVSQYWSSFSYKWRLFVLGLIAFSKDQSKFQNLYLLQNTFFRFRLFYFSSL